MKKKKKNSETIKKNFQNLFAFYIYKLYFYNFERETVTLSSSTLVSSGASINFTGYFLIK